MAIPGLAADKLSRLQRFEPLLRRVLIGIAVFALGWQWIASAIKPRGDFVQFLKSGQRFLDGTFFYEGGHMLPYTVVWAMVHAPFSLLPPRIAMPLFFVLGLTAFVLLLVVLEKLTGLRNILDRQRAFYVVAITLFLTSRFWIRDFADGGQNTVLLTLTWGALFLHIRNRPLPAGALLGFATALKCTPFVFIAFLAFKRGWRTAGSAILFAILFLLLPLCFRSPELYAREMKTWAKNVWKGSTGRDPSTGILGKEPLQNSALKPALARYLMALPEGHPGRFAGAGHIDFLNLKPGTASGIIRLVMIAGAVTLAWQFRRRTAPDLFIIECACVSVAALLASPITWGQHCVATIPLVYLLTLHRLRGHFFPRWITILLALAAVIVAFTSRGILGKQAALLIQSYHAETLALILLLIAGLWLRRSLWKTDEILAPRLAKPTCGDLPNYRYE